MFVAGFVTVVVMQPTNFTVFRSSTINASASEIFPHVNNLHNWAAWSPWAKLDPNGVESLSGPESGIGATMTWSGNSDVGEGTMTITESRINEFIRMSLKFVRPFKAEHDAEFAFVENDGKTFVTWTMLGKNNFIGKAMSLFINCDEMVGGQMEEGLANIKAITENPTP